MKPDQKIALLLTFLTGAFCGAALYILVFAPQYEAQQLEEQSRFAVVGTLYGACDAAAAGCPSFRFEADRTFRYIAGSNRQEGKLPGKIYDPITELMTTDRLRQYARPVEFEDCSQVTASNQVRYDITLEGVRYTLDSCRTAFPTSSEMQKRFIEAWRYMENPTTTYPTILEEGIGGWLQERMRSNDSE